MAATNTSSYLIDTSKKCYIKDCPKIKLEGSEIAIPAILFGDLDSKCLQNIGFEVREDFKASKEEVQNTIDNVLKVVKTTMEGLLKRWSLFKDLNLELSSENLRDSVVYFKTIQEIMGAKAGSSIHDFLDQIGNKVNKYNVPVRNAPPATSPISGSSITIKFAYGKCNLFSAKEEVWLPLNALKNAYFPRTSEDPEEEGLVHIEAGASVPYPQEASALALKQLFDPENGLINIPNVIRTLASSASLQDTFDGNVQFTGKSKTITKAGDLEKVKTRYANLFSAIPDAQEAVKTAAERLTLSEGQDSFETSALAEDLVAEGMSKANELKESSNANRGESNIDNTYYVSVPKQKIDVNSINKDNISGLVKLKHVEETTRKKLDNLDSVLKGMVMLVPKISARTATRLRESVRGAVNIRMGFPSVYKTSIEEIAELLVPGGIYERNSSTTENYFQPDIIKTDNKFLYSKLDPKIILRDVLLQKFSIKFDFSQTDEYGFPMSGTFNIEQFWNLNFPGYTLYLGDPDHSNGNRQKALTTSYIDYLDKATSN